MCLYIIFVRQSKVYVKAECSSQWSLLAYGDAGNISWGWSASTYVVSDWGSLSPGWSSALWTWCRVGGFLGSFNDVNSSTELETIVLHLSSPLDESSGLAWADLSSSDVGYSGVRDGGDCCTGGGLCVWVESNEDSLSKLGETNCGWVAERADTSSGRVSGGSAWASWGGECEVAVGWEAIGSRVQANEILISLQERLEGSGLGSGEEESKGDEGGFHYFNLFLNR